MRLVRAAIGAALLAAAVVVPSPAASAGEVELIPDSIIGGSGHAALYGWGAATAQDGSVYIGDYWNQRIQHYAKDGTLLGTVVPKSKPGAAPHQPPYGIAVDPRNGDIYFGDVDSDATVDKYDKNGNFLFEFGGKGTGLGFFDYPSRVAVAPDGKVIVSDSRAEKLSIWDSQGNPLFDKKGQLFGTPTLGRPRGIALDDNGFLYVADALLQKVQVFQFNADFTDLTFVRSMGTPKDHPGEPLAGELGLDLRGLAVDDERDALYVVDADTGYVAKFRKSTGQFIRFFGGNGTAIDQFSGGGRDVTVDGDGNVWVGDMPNFRAVKFSPDGEYLGQVPDPVVKPPTGGFNQPRGVAVDSSGNVFVTDTHNWRIQKFDAQGRFVTQWGSRGSGNNQFNYSKGIAVSWQTGDVAVADTDGNAIKLFDNNGTFLCSIDKFGSEPGQFMGPLSVDFGADGRIYVADTQNGRVQVLEKVAVSGGCDLRVRPTNGVFGGKGTTAGRFQATNGIAVDTDGSLWVSDRLLGRVTHLSNTGQFLGSFGGGVGTGDTQFERAGDVEVDDRYVYISDSENDQLKVWRKDGTFVRTVGSTGGLLGQFQRPHGMDLTPDGTLYVSEQTNERISVFKLARNVNPESVRPDGTVTAPAANQSVPLGPLQLSGGATDDSGVALAQVAIKNVATNKYWTGAAWGPFTWLTAQTAQRGLGTTSTTWTYNWTPPAAGSYGVQARVQDVWGNVDSTVPYRTFSVYAGVLDTARPDTTLTSPVNGSSIPLGVLSVGGSSTDNVGVTRAQVAIKNSGTGKFWTGSAWGTFTWLEAAVANPGAATSAWSYSWTPPVVGSFGVQARAGDAAGNWDNTAPYSAFSVYDGPPDSIRPTGAVTSPVSGQRLTGTPLVFAGTASDNLGVAGAQVAIKSVATGKWWTGSSWGSLTWLNATLTDPGTTNTVWTYAWSPPGPGSYGVQLQVKDRAGLSNSPKPYVGFSFS